MKMCLLTLPLLSLRLSGMLSTMDHHFLPHNHLLVHQMGTLQTRVGA